MKVYASYRVPTRVIAFVSVIPLFGFEEYGLSNLIQQIVSFIVIWWLASFFPPTIFTTKEGLKVGGKTYSWRDLKAHEVLSTSHGRITTIQRSIKNYLYLNDQRITLPRTGYPNYRRLYDELEKNTDFERKNTHYFNTGIFIPYLLGLFAFVSLSALFSRYTIPNMKKVPIILGDVASMITREALAYYFVGGTLLLIGLIVLIMHHKHKQ